MARLKLTHLIIWAGCLCIILATASGSAGPVQNKAPTRTTKPSRSGTKATMLEEERLDLERQRLADEKADAREKAQIEWAKLEIEKSWRSIFSSSVPLIVAFLTLGFSIWSLQKQKQQQNETQLSAARSQFELKAAEIAFSGKTPEAVLNRARALRTAFGKRLPDNFLDSFDPVAHGGGKEAPEEKKFFLELLLKYPDQQTQAYALWSALFGDEWLKRAEPLIKNKGS